MAAQDLGDMKAEILEVKHAIRSDTPCPVHGCDGSHRSEPTSRARSCQLDRGDIPQADPDATALDAGYTAQQL